MEFIVHEEKDRLDKYISNKTDEISRVMIQKLIDKGEILVNGKSQKASYKVQNGDKISINIPEVKEVGLKSQDIPLDIIYEDNDILVVNKPKGMVVHPAVGNLDGTLVNAVMAHCKDNLSGIGGEVRPGIVHRLDKDTSGIVVFAKSERVKESLQNTWDYTERNYIAVVHGITKDKDTIKSYLKETKTLYTYSTNDKSGKYAETSYVRVKSNKQYSLLKINIKTGRKNQIRVHMKDNNTPILGDKKYGKKDGYRKMMLLANEIKFIHPVTKEIIHIDLKIPNEYSKIVE